MKRFSIPLGLALATLTLLAADTPTHAGERPFNGSGGGIVYNDLLPGLGEATHLGRSTLRLSVDVSQLANGSFSPSRGQLSSASGEVLYFSMEPIEGGTEVFTFITTLTFTGGSGRFQDATGSADVMFVFDTNYQQFLFLIDGSIDY